MNRKKILVCTNSHSKYDILNLMSKIINLCNPSNYGFVGHEWYLIIDDEGFFQL